MLAGKFYLSFPSSIQKCLGGGVVVALLICSSSAALVGGMLSVLRDILVKRVILGVFTVRQYMMTTNRSSFWIALSGGLLGNRDGKINVSVISGHASQVFHADLLP